ncbi:hypothetical protein GF357_03235, partial [Candidatus Dojkabacteria bacterium]|nr:hypothetical protein [Candidatus Dojkabacteria bacterium]
MARTLNRRDFLEIAALATAGTFLTACGVKGEPTEAPSAQPTLTQGEQEFLNSLTEEQIAWFARENRAQLYAQYTESFYPGEGLSEYFAGARESFRAGKPYTFTVLGGAFTNQVTFEVESQLAPEEQRILTPQMPAAHYIGGFATDGSPTMYSRIRVASPPSEFLEDPRNSGYLTHELTHAWQWATIMGHLLRTEVIDMN